MFHIKHTIAGKKKKKKSHVSHIHYPFPLRKEQKNQDVIQQNAS